MLFLFNQYILFSARSSRKRRFMSVLLCCLSVSNRNRPKSAIYSPKNESPTNEVNISSLRKKKRILIHYFVYHISLIINNLLVAYCIEF